MRDEHHLGADDTSDSPQRVPSVQTPECSSKPGPPAAKRPDEQWHRRAHRRSRQHQHRKRRDAANEIDQPESVEERTRDGCQEVREIDQRVGQRDAADSHEEFKRRVRLQKATDSVRIPRDQRIAQGEPAHEAR